jgi:hypothetical protein
MNATMETLALWEFYVPEYVSLYIRTIQYVPWVFSLLGSALIGLSGILPLLIIPSTETDKDKEIKNRESMTDKNRAHSRNFASPQVTFLSAKAINHFEGSSKSHEIISRANRK